jgi:phosphoglycolate phosphatase-like HAD superfamily hydrolase
VQLKCPIEAHNLYFMIFTLFDIDGTLISSGGAGKAAMEKALQSEFGVRQLVDKVPYSGRTDRAIALDLLQLHGIDPSTLNWRRLRSAYLSHLPTSLVQHRGTVLPGVATLLEDLGSRPMVHLGLLTGNIREGARLKLGHYQLFHHFTFGGFGDDHLDRDDVARSARAMAYTKLNGADSPRDVWVVGDTPLDIQCARAIGAKVIAVATGWHSLTELTASNPDLLLADLSDGAAVLQAMSL